MKDNHIFVIGNETCSDLVQYVKPNKLELTCKSMRSDAEYLSSDMESNLKAILVKINRQKEEKVLCAKTRHLLAACKMKPINPDAAYLK